MVNSPPDKIEESPVVLRRYRSGDFPALLQAVSSSIDHLRPWLAWASAEPLEQGLAEFISNSIEAFDRGDNFDYGLWDDSETTLVGGAGLHPRLGPGRIEIGYWVSAGWLRRGIASSAALALTRTAFQLPEIEEVHIHCDEANFASARVPKALGFRLVRTVEDEVSAPAETGRSMEWVLSVSDWQGES